MDNFYMVVMDLKKITRLIACGLLLLAIANLPYGYYRFLRISITIISGINLFIEFNKENKLLFIFFLLVLILFNPIIPIYLNKETWTPIDLISGIFFGVSAFLNTNEKNDKNVS